MKKIILKAVKGLVIGVIAVILVTLGIDASDNFNNLSESIFGRLIFGEENGPCPKEMVFVPTENGGFCIDKFEAAPDETCPYFEVIDQEKTRENLNDSSCKPVSKIGVKPWRFISQSQAAVACAKAGKRLPTDEEWYLASLGTPDPNTDWGKENCHVNKNWDGQPGQTGSGEYCVSSYGAYDMVGNVWEWVKGEIVDGKFSKRQMPESGFVKAIDSRGIPTQTSEGEPDINFNNDFLWIKSSGVRGMARGGYWDNKEGAGVYAMYLVSPTSFAGKGIGFRCAR